MSWNYAFFEYYLSMALLIVSMLGMGATLSPRDFMRVARAPRVVVLVLVFQVLVTPLVALGFAGLLSVPRGVAMGMLLVAALPGGLFSNFFTFLGRGNLALSITATAVATVGCVFTVTLVLRTFGTAYFHGGVTVPLGRVLLEIFGGLMLPLLVGMATRRFAEEICPMITKLCTRASILMLLAIIVGAVSSGYLDPLAFGWRAPLALVLLAIASLWLCYGVGYLLKLRPADTFTLGVEVVLRNGNLGLLLKAALFPAVAAAQDAIGDGVLYAIVLYAVISMIVTSGEVMAHRMRVGLVFGRRRNSIAGSGWRQS